MSSDVQDIKAFYSPVASIIRPCKLAMFVPDAGAAIIYPSGWTEPKTVSISQVHMPDEVDTRSGSNQLLTFTLKAKTHGG